MTRQPPRGVLSRVERLGRELGARHGSLGVPATGFDRAGRQQFIALLREGLSPESRLLEIGCGVLREAYWLVRFLDAGNYCAIEPHRDRVRWGLDGLLGAELAAAKRPRFDHNAGFDTSVFGETFDFCLAGSIWTHADKRQIQTMLDGFLRDGASTAVFLTSYLPARTREEDYRGTGWVGTGPTSSTPGIVRHSLTWIRRACRARDLRVGEVPGPAFDGQTWLRIHRGGKHPNPQHLPAPETVPA